MKNNCIYKRDDKCISIVIPNCPYYKEKKCFYDEEKNILISYQMRSTKRRSERRMEDYR